MRLTIKEISRESDKIIRTYGEWYFETIDECLEYVKRLDEQFKKGHSRFEYVIKGE